MISHVELEGLEELYYLNNFENDKVIKPALEIFHCTNLGTEAIWEIEDTKGTAEEQDVYFVTGSLSSETTNGFTQSFGDNALDENGQLLKSVRGRSKKDQEKLDLLMKLDFRQSKNKKFSVILINSNSKLYKDASKEETSTLSEYVSETIYHELWAHVILKIKPYKFINDVRNMKQEHFRYHGQYSRYSPQKDTKTPGTQRQKFINETKEVTKELEIWDLE